MKFGQTLEYNKRKFFFEKYAQNDAERLVPDLFLFFKRFIKSKNKCSTA